VTEAAKVWLCNGAGLSHRKSPALGIHLLLGAEFPEMAANFAQNILDGRIGLVMAIGQKR
jgi:hypothetical protein